jgi:hypothetical protein
MPTVWLTDDHVPKPDIMSIAGHSAADADEETESDTAEPVLHPRRDHGCRIVA